MQSWNYVGALFEVDNFLILNSDEVQQHASKLHNDSLLLVLACFMSRAKRAAIGDLDQRTIGDLDHQSTTGT